MKVLLTGPNIYDKKRLGGIITVANTILALFPEMEYFARSGEQQKSKIAAFTGFYKILQAFKKRIAAGGLDIIHVNSALERNAVARDILFVRMARKRNIPIVLHIHGGKYLTYNPDPVTGRMIRYMLGAADQIIVLGKVEKQQLADKYGLNNIHILQNALDFSDIPKPKEKLHSSPLRFIYLGRIDHYKGLEDILTALSAISNNGVSYRYILYGNGPLTDSYRSSCEEVLGDKFEFGGVVLGEDKWSALNSSDVFLLPSLYEGLPMSLLEAMAVGALCITTPVGSIPEVIQNRKNGILIDKENPKQLQAIIEEIISDPESFRPLAASGLVTVREKFNGEVYRANLESIYRKV